MSHPYYDIAFTPTVCALQERDGSRMHYRDGHIDDVGLGQEEAAFIEAADHFFQATVSETGWPYVQHRGGPAGFLRVIDAHTIGFADLRGNRQFISQGNLLQDGRIALILMDWVAKRRLKLMGRARVVERDDDPALLARLAVAGYGHPERAYLVQVEAFDWNCPQHITQRYTRASVDQAMGPLREQNNQLRAALADAARLPQLATGDGPWHLVVRAIRQVSPRVRLYELASADGSPLPPEVAAGAHLEVPVRLPDGQQVLRHYSLMPVAGSVDAVQIAVQREAQGRGASAAIHAQWLLGLELHLPLPRNHFLLHQDARPALLLAAGIGMTPLIAMAQHLQAQGRQFALHVGVRRRDEAALLPRQLEQLTVHVSGESGRMDIDRLIGEVAADTVVYACGPEPFIEQVATAAQARQLAVRVERFAPAATRRGDHAVTVTLARSGRVVQVAAGTSILEALEQAGIDAPASCRTGECGTCSTVCLAGEPDHRDQCLSDHDRNAAKRMCPCVSRAKGQALTLDL